MANLFTKRDRRYFKHNGFLFVFDKYNSDGTVQFWKCKNKKICKSRIHTVNDQVTFELHTHSHGPDAAGLEAVRGRHVLKDFAANTQESTGQVIARVNGALSLAGRVQMVEDFLVFDSITDQNRPPPERVLIFSTERNLEFLSQSDTWHADGTFELEPPLFQQLYTIHGNRFGGLHPLATALLPDKRQETYEYLFQRIRDLTGLAQPQQIMTDFELASINAFATTFPNAEQSGCFFHLGQSNYRKLNSLHLGHRYATEPDFALQCKMIPALAFVPLHDVEQVFLQLERTVDADLDPMLDYMEEFYIGKVNRRGPGRRIPMFPMRLWNMYDRVMNNRDRTNNKVEGYHRGTQALLQMAHPTIWKLIDGLRSMQQLRDGLIEQQMAGQAANPPRRTYRELNLRILRIVNDYENRDPMDYLRGIAHNYSF